MLASDPPPKSIGAYYSRVGRSNLILLLNELVRILERVLDMTDRFVVRQLFLPEEIDCQGYSECTLLASTLRLVVLFSELESAVHNSSYA